MFLGMEWYWWLVIAGNGVKKNDRSKEADFLIRER
mgnify:CR=1 FL=1